MWRLAANMMNILLDPAVIGMAALFLSVMWMLRDEKDRTRPLLVIVLGINLFYGWLLSFVMGQERDDPVQVRLHPAKSGHRARRSSVRCRGIASAGTFTAPGDLSIDGSHDDCLVPVAREHGQSRPIVVAYIAEMTTGPLLYTIVPGCGPLHAFSHAVAASAHCAFCRGSVDRNAECFPSLRVAATLRSSRSPAADYDRPSSSSLREQFSPRSRW